ncbi:MAG: hypothetical protein AAF067_12790 [Pseudomonadota bacterium]
MILWIALAVSVLYSVGLFWLALRGDGGRISLAPRAKSWIYGLSLAVYCTSWTFYGAVGTALSSGWHFLPIYLGPILLFTLGYGIVARTLQLGKSHHSTSIADFLSTRYGKSGAVAALVTIIATVGLLPYVALQLKSVGQTLFALSPDIGAAVNPDDVVLGVAAIMALFSILFGARQIDLTQHNRGMVLTIAVEAIVKMLALLAVALFALFLFAGNDTVQTDAASGFREIFYTDQFDNRFVVLTLISACAALCLPRQFHMTIVEAQKDRQAGSFDAICVSGLSCSHCARGFPDHRSGHISPFQRSNKPGYADAGAAAEHWCRLACHICVYRRFFCRDRHGDCDNRRAIRHDHQ